jgi:hypothetical protein
VKRLWRDYNLSVVLGLLFVASWIGQLITQWFNWVNEQQDHHQPLQVGAFLWQFWESTLENWQSEFLQLFSFVVLSALCTHRGSAESKDSDEQMQRAWTGSSGGSRPGTAGRGPASRAADGCSSAQRCAREVKSCRPELPRSWPDGDDGGGQRPADPVHRRAQPATAGHPMTAGRELP